MINQKDIIISEETRNKLIEGNDNILNKLKAIPFFSDNTFVGISQAASYYGVEDTAIKGVIRRNKEELYRDGLTILTSSELTKYKLLEVSDPYELNNLYIGQKARQYTAIPRRALLKIAMLLTQSKFAQEVRSYLLNIEHNSSFDQKMKSIEETTNTKLVVSPSNMINEKEQIKIDIKKLEYKTKEKAACAKIELIEFNTSMKKLIASGLSKAEASLIIQKSKIVGSCIDSAILDEINKLNNLESNKQRGIIRLKLEKIASEYYDDNIRLVYCKFAEKMKYQIGIDMRAIRSRAKKKFGEKSTMVPSYLDLIAENKAYEDANMILDIIVTNAIEEDELAKSLVGPESYIEKKKRMNEDVIKSKMHISKTINESNISRK